MDQYPENIEMEKYLLGTMMLKSGETIPEIASRLEAEDFFRPEHRILFSLMLKMYREHVTPNTLSVAEELRKIGKLEEIELGYVLYLPQTVHSTAYVKLYCDTIKQKSIARKLMNYLDKAKEAAEKDIAPINDIAADVVKVVSEIGQPATKYLYDVSDMTAEYLKHLANSAKYTGRKTGFTNLDEHHTPFRPGVYVLGAIPAAGKTTFCWQMAEQFACQGENVYYFTYEIGRNELWAKSLARGLLSWHFALPPSASAILSADPQGRLAKAAVQYANDLIDKITQIGGHLNIVEADNSFTADKITSLLMRDVSKNKKSPIVFIDYLQKVPHNKELTRDGIDSVIRSFKFFQRQYDVTFIIITSYNRMNYRQQVSMESAKESGGIDYEADVVWGMQLYVTNQYRTGMSDSDMRKLADEALKEFPRKIQLKCMKNRNGENYDCYFNYYSVSAHFEPARDFSLEGF